LIFWNVNQNPTSSQITVFDPGNYFCIVIDNHGCVDSTLITNPTPITVYHPQPQISFQNNIFVGPSGFAQYQWYKGGQPLSGATGQTYNATASGSYSLLVTDIHGCTGWSNVIEYTYVGIEDPEGAEIGLKIMPNPTEGVFEIQANFGTKTKTRIEIYDMLGKRVIQPQDESLVGEFARQYNLNHLSDGVYTVKIVAGEKTYIKRLIKE
jgi:hypothetical protein